MEDYIVKQIQPNHADHISYYRTEYVNNMLHDEAVIAQPKYDGERMLIHVTEGQVFCTSRRFSKKTGRYTENQDKLPILARLLEGFPLGYTVLDCECYSKDWSTIVGILHSLPERAVELQKQDVAKFAVFDCLFYDGHDLRDTAYYERLKYARKVVDMIGYENLHLVQFIDENLQPSDVVHATMLQTVEQLPKAMNNAISAGFEGIVVKSLLRNYYDKAASLKVKKFETVDCVVCGYEQGRGKYSNTIGALIIGYYDKEKNDIIPISRVNCGTDAERNMWRDRWAELQYSVIEVKCQEITKRSLRHPVYIRLRDDKDYTMCTVDTIFKTKDEDDA